MLKRNLPSFAAVGTLLILWQLVCLLGLIPPYMLPSPLNVLQAFVDELPLLWENSLITLQEAFIGLLFGVGVGFIAALLMDAFDAVQGVLSIAGNYANNPVCCHCAAVGTVVWL